MRVLLLITLLASAAAAPAQTSDRRGDGDSRRAQRAEAREEARSERREARRAERQADDASTSASEDPPAPRRQAETQRTPEPRQFEPSNDEAPAARRAAGDTVRTWRQRDRDRSDSPAAIEQRNLATQADDDSPAAERPRRRAIADGMRRAPDGDGDGDRVFDRQVRTTPGIGDRRLGRIGRNVPAEGTAPPPPTRAQVERGQTTRHWRGDWRSDRRYDWRRHRDRNRSRFHLGFYFDPFGWSYRRYGIGWRLWPSYYHSSYWLNDPWYYRLPPAYGPYRWVRYHGDALLVNIYTGEVVDVIYDFFW